MYKEHSVKKISTIGFHRAEIYIFFLMSVMLDYLGSDRLKSIYRANERILWLLIASFVLSFTILSSLKELMIFAYNLSATYYHAGVFHE